MTATQETVLMAAIRFKGRIWAGYTMHAMIAEEIVGYYEDEDSAEDGFVTTEGRFIDREEAAQLAEETKRRKDCDFFYIGDSNGLHSPELAEPSKAEFKAFYENVCAENGIILV